MSHSRDYSAGYSCDHCLVSSSDIITSTPSGLVSNAAYIIRTKQYGWLQVTTNVHNYQ